MTIKRWGERHSVDVIDANDRQPLINKIKQFGGLLDHE